MKFCISFGKFELKYFFYCVLFFIIEIFIYFFVYNDNDSIINKHYLLHSFCYFLGFLLNFILIWISQEEKPIINKSTKDILKFFFICLILLLADLIENIQDIISAYNNLDNIYNDYFIFTKFLIFFLVSKFDNEVYYKHQNISFFILIVLEVIKNIYFFIQKL